MGGMSTDFTKIKPGYLHEANGSYLIIQAKDIFTKSYAWESLKRALLNEKIHIENIGEHSGLATTVSLKPDAIPLDVKVIVIGDVRTFQILYNYEEDFRKLRSEEHTSELQSRGHLVCRLLLENKNK